MERCSSRRCRASRRCRSTTSRRSRLPITPKTVAVMLEPIQGEAGVFVATDAFLRGLRALTRRARPPADRRRDPDRHRPHRQALRLRACRHRARHHDAGKGLGGGVPLAALVAHDDVCCFAHGDQGGTFNGNPLMTAVGCAVMEEVRQPGFLRGRRRSALPDGAAAELSRKHGCGDVRGQGTAARARSEARHRPAVVERALERGLLMNAPRPNMLRFMPALNVTTTRSTR